jgi:hypothetical protein
VQAPADLGEILCVAVEEPERRARVGDDRGERLRRSCAIDAANSPRVASFDARSSSTCALWSSCARFCGVTSRMMLGILLDSQRTTRASKHLTSPDGSGISYSTTTGSSPAKRRLNFSSNTSERAGGKISRMLRPRNCDGGTKRSDSSLAL